MPIRFDSKMKIYIIILITSSCALKIYHSTLPISRNSGLSGLKYKNEPKKDINFNDGLTACARFNYKKLGRKAWLFDFGTNGGDDREFLWFRIAYPATWFGLGNKKGGKGYVSSWVLQDPKTENYNIWYANKWHHVCIAFDAKRSHIAVIKVCIIYKVFAFSRVPISFKTWGIVLTYSDVFYDGANY